MNKKILIDLDVVTVGKWDAGKYGDIARNLIKRIENKEFQLITPFYMIEHLLKWKNIQLKEKMKDFYTKESHSIVTNEDVDSKIEELKIDDTALLNQLKNHNIKEEDAFIVMITSIFELDYLITFNRIHLKNNKELINEVLRKNGLKNIKIVGPEEV